MLRTFASVAFASIVLVPLPASAQHQHPATHQHAAGAGHEQLGTVDFATSCTAAARPDFNRAVALLHSFEFGDAIKGFTAALGKDPSCAMAEWGIAMSRWGNPFSPSQRAPGPLKEGAAAVARGKALAPKTPREQAYLDAVATLFADVDTVDQRTRIVAYRDAMATVAASNTADVEAQVFYALSIAGSHTPSDKTYANLLKAAGILEGLIEKYPQHPGLAHYIIHSYDVPALADRALVAARRYATIAPSAPHALHMPSHTFTRVGSWQESIDTNVASATSARTLGSVGEELHAMDYQAYAALQTGQDAAARALARRAAGRQGALRPRRDRRRRAGLRRPVRAGCDPGPLCARARRLEGGSGARAGAEPLPLSRGADLVRQGARRRPRRRRGDDQGGDRRADADPRRADHEERGLLGRAGRNPATLGDGVAGARRRPERRSAGRDDGGGRSRGQDREGGGDAGPAGAGA